MDSNDPGFSDVGDPERLVGSVVADRYLLTRLLSAGANTLIFDSDDTRSHRRVTLKALRPDLLVDAGFRDRFDGTIRQVASLSHPNIAAVFDWGVARVGGQPTTFVVSERLGAGSLRDLYDRSRRLSPSQALALGLDVCRGLDHAHRRGLVHGELSPSKLVFGDDRRVRIVDFGLTALLADRVWAEPSSVPTHVARYASPEQALGMPIDGTTDVYALCLALVEGVTGVLPFASDSTVSTLAARVGRLMPVSADLGPLASVLERAGRPEAPERATAAQFGRGLVQVAEKLPRPEPLPVVVTSLFETPDEQLRAPEDPTGGPMRPSRTDVLVVTHDDDAVEPEVEPEPEPEPEAEVEVEPEPVVEPEPEAEQVPVLETEPEPEPEVGMESPLPLELVVLDVDDTAPTAAVISPDVDDTAPTAAVVSPDVDDTVPNAVTFVHDDFGEAPPRRRSRRLGLAARILIPVLIIAALAVLAVLATRLFVTPTHEVPELAGLGLDVAESTIEEFSWDVTTELIRSDEEPRPGVVIRTVPSEGARLAEGEPFLFVVSEGPVFRVLPELIELSFVDAEVALTELALVPVIVEEHHEDVPRGGLIRWSVVGEPDLVAGDEVLPGTEVEIVTSIGPAPRTVPDLAGTDLGGATAAVEELRLELEEIEPQFSDEVPAGQVLTQSPAPGTTVSRGAVVQIAISRGPDVVELPDLTGTDFPQAQALLAEQGLVARLEFGAIDGEFLRASVDGSVVEAGDVIRRGSQVDVIFL